MWFFLLSILQLAIFVVVAPVLIVFTTVCRMGLWVGELVSGRRPPRPRSIVITGASSGIGEGLALRYAGEGVALALTGRSEERLDTVAKACRERGAEVRLGVLDVADQDAMERFLIEFDDAHPVDLVVANAGVTEGTTRTTKDLARATRLLFATNVDGLFNTVLPLLERLKQRRRGQVAIMASIAGYGALTPNVAYSASKAAVRTWGDGLRRYLHRYGVHVSVICPGYVRTNMTARNTYYMPGLMNLDDAVTRIVHGLARDEATIAFPHHMYALVWFVMHALPDAVRDVIARLRLSGDIAYLRRRFDGSASSAGGKEE